MSENPRSWMNLRLFPIAGSTDQTALEALETWAGAAKRLDASPLVNMPKRPRVAEFVLATGNELAYAVDEMRTRLAIEGEVSTEPMWVTVALGQIEEIEALA